MSSSGKHMFSLDTKHGHVITYSWS